MKTTYVLRRVLNEQLKLWWEPISFTDKECAINLGKQFIEIHKAAWPCAAAFVDRVTTEQIWTVGGGK